MLNIAVVEDDPEYRAQITGFINQFAAEKKKDISIKEFVDGREISFAYEKVFDIIFLDIELPSENGMKTAEKIRRIDADVVIVFITNMAQYAIKGYEVDALDFILKPVNYFTFSKRFERAINRVSNKREKLISLSMQNRIVTLSSQAVYYVESSNRFLNYYTKDEVHTTRGVMKSVEEELAPFNFVRCNHWYLVNLEHVSGIEDNFVILGSYRLEISRRNKTSFIKSYTDFISGVR